MNINIPREDGRLKGKLTFTFVHDTNLNPKTQKSKLKPMLGRCQILNTRVTY